MHVVSAVMSMLCNLHVLHKYVHVYVHVYDIVHVY